ncbi:MAG: hypothetical protein ABIY50_12165 [Ignavibacteria bacterium]
MNTPNKILPIIIGTMVMTMISAIPILNLINVFCCAGIIAGGFAGVYSYWKQLQNSGVLLTSKDGGMIGILCGILSAIFVTGFGVLISLFSDINPMLDLMKGFDEMGIQMPDQMIQYMDKFSEEFNQHGFSPSITIFSFIFNLILYPAFGSIGALLGVSLLNKKNNQTV